MRADHYLSIIGAIYITPALHDACPIFLPMVGIVCMIAAVAIHLYVGRDCDMGDGQ